jgi:hypothetical protein
VLIFSGTPEQVQKPIVPALKSSLWSLAIAYDKTRNQLIASAILSNTKSAVVGLNPVDLSVIWSVSTTSPATVLAISDDGSMLYAGLFYESAVQQIDLGTRSSVRAFALAAPDSGLGAFDIAVRPGSPDTVAVSLGDVILIPTFRALALYVQGVRQPNDFKAGINGNGTRSSQIEFLDSSTLLGLDNETTAFTLQKYSVSSDGLTPTSWAPGGCCGSHLSVTNGQVFLSSGSFVDPVTLKGIKTITGGSQDLKAFQAGTNSVLKISVPDSGYHSSAQLLIEEYDVDRGYLKRRFRGDESIAGTIADLGVIAQVLDAVPIGQSTFALLVADALTGFTTILVYDLAAIPLLEARTFSAQASTTGNVSALSIAIPARSLAYDPAGDRLVATVPAELGPQGNALAIIRASDGVVERFVPFSSEPENLAVSQSGSIAYVNLPSERAMQQVDLNTGATGPKVNIEFPSTMPLNQYPFPTVPFSPASIAVKPDDPQTIAIAGDGLAVAVLQNGVPYGPLLFPDGSRPFTSMVAFNGPTEILGLDTQSTNGSIQRFSLVDSVFVAVSTTPDLLNLDITTKVGSGFAYDRYSLVDLQANRVAGRFTPGSADYFFFDQTLLLSPASGIGYHERLVTGGIVPFYELLTRAAKPDGSLEFSGQSRIRIDDPRFPVGFRGLLLPTGAKRFAQSFINFHDGTGVIYLVSTP